MSELDPLALLLRMDSTSADQWLSPGRSPGSQNRLRNLRTSLVGRHQVEVNPQATNDMVEVVDIIGAVDKTLGWGNSICCPSMVGICSDTDLCSVCADDIISDFI